MANLIADRAECRRPKMAACSRNAAWSAYCWQCDMIGIPAVRHSDTGQTGKIGSFRYRY